MTEDKKTTRFKIDATNRPIGRVATEVAVILMGKNSPDYRPNVDNENRVRVLNVSNAKFTGKKLDQKVYYRHSLYPGGLKETPVRKVLENNPQEVMRIAVRNMLPNNRLRNNRLKRLSFK
jgi:large subunit ribosomal protein L13